MTAMQSISAKVEELTEDTTKDTWLILNTVEMKNQVFIFMF